MNTLDDIANINKYSEYYSTVSDIVKNETVLKMKIECMILLLMLVFSCFLYELCYM